MIDLNKKNQCDCMNDPHLGGLDFPHHPYRVENNQLLVFRRIKTKKFNKIKKKELNLHAQMDRNQNF